MIPRLAVAGTVAVLPAAARLEPAGDERARR